MGGRPVIINLASGNAHKAAEFQRLAVESGLEINILPAHRMPPVVEDAGTFVGNARKKAIALQALLPGSAWVLADDSGICVDALNGAPGVESAYYAGPEHDSAANLAKLTDVMRPILEERGAYFYCVLVLRGPGEAEQIFDGRCDGVLATTPAGGRGFGYDPLFIPDGFDRTYAQLTEGEKNKLSHRGRAWLRLADWLRKGF